MVIAYVKAKLTHAIGQARLIGWQAMDGVDF